jgi:hypothetical protein
LTASDAGKLLRRGAGSTFQAVREGNDEGWSSIGAEPRLRPSPAPARVRPASTGRSHTMLWTILIILVIIALALFILGRVRGR